MKRILLTIFAVVLFVSTPAGVQAQEAVYGQAPIYLGDLRVDYMAEQILKEIPLEGKTAMEQIQAVYDWVILNSSRYDWDGVYHFDADAVHMQAMPGGEFRTWVEQEVEAGRILLRHEFNPYSMYDSNYYIAVFAEEMMMKRTGNCAHYSALLAVLLGHLGYDCRLLDGEFINRDGSSVMHKWNEVLVDGQYYALDSRIDHSMYTSTGSIGYYYFMEPDITIWAQQHNWDQSYSVWLRENAAVITQVYVEDMRNDSEIETEMQKDEIL